MTQLEFFTALANGAKWGVPATISRSGSANGGLPIDAYSIFKSKEDAVLYASQNKAAVEAAGMVNNAYIGQIVTVWESKTVGEETVDTVEVFYIDADKTLKPVGIVPTGDNKTIEVTTAGAISLLGAAGAANGTLPMIDDKTGKLVWKTLKDIGAGDGNDNTTYEFAFADQKIVITPKFNGQPIVENETQVKYELDLSTFVTGDELTEAIKDFVTTDTTYSVKDGEKILKLEGTEFSTVASLKYVPAVAANAEAGTEAVPAKIQLLGIDNALVSEIDATPFIKDGMLDDVSYDADSNTLTFTWNTEAGPKTDTVVLSDIIEPYTAGDGLDLEGNEFSVKIDASSEAFLSVGENGVKLAGVQDAITVAKGEAIADAEGKIATAKQEALSAVAENYYNKNQINEIIGAPGTPAEGEEGSEGYKPAVVGTGVYQHVYSKSEVTDLIADITGGESAADVKAELKEYKTTNDARVLGIEKEIWGTKEDGSVKDPNGDSRIDIIESKLNGIEAGAEVNIIESISINDGKPLTPDDNRNVKITIPTKLSDLTDDIAHVSNVIVKATQKDDQGNTVYESKLKADRAAGTNIITLDDSALQNAINAVNNNTVHSISVNNTPVDADAQHKVNITAATGSQNGTIAIAGQDVAVKGLDALAYKSKVGTTDVDPDLTAEINKGVTAKTNITDNTTTADGVLVWNRAIADAQGNNIVDTYATKETVNGIGIAASEAILRSPGGTLEYEGAKIVVNGKDVAIVSSTNSNVSIDYSGASDVYGIDGQITVSVDGYTKAETNAAIAALAGEGNTSTVKANADAIKTLIGNVEGDNAKSVRTIAAEEVATIVAGADAEYDTLKEIADFIINDISGAAGLTNTVNNHSALLNGIGGTDEPETVIEAIRAAAYVLPGATAETLGGIKSAKDVVDGATTTTALNKVYVDATTNVGEVKAVSTDILAQGTLELVLYGGNADGIANA